MEEFVDNQFDNIFFNIKALKWKPWVGKNYLDKKKPKLLILGESHYLWKGEKEAYDIINDPKFTRAFVKNSGLYFDSDFQNPNAHIIRNTERVLFNKKDSSNEMKRELWYSVSYMVIVQKMLSSIKERPNDNDYINGWKSVFKVIDIIKPDFILSLGVENASRIKPATKECKYELTAFKKGDKINRTYTRKAKIKNASKEIPIIFIKHPSSYFSWQKWSEYVEKEMNEYTNALNRKSP